MFYDMQKITQSRTFRKLLEISSTSIKKDVSSNCKNDHGHSFPSISPKRSEQLVYVNTNLQKVLKVANSLKSKFEILKGENSFDEQILSLKNRKTAFVNSENIRMLQTHVNNDIYNKYCLIHNNDNRFLSFTGFYTLYMCLCLYLIQRLLGCKAFEQTYIQYNIL